MDKRREDNNKWIFFECFNVRRNVDSWEDKTLQHWRIYHGTENVEEANTLEMYSRMEKCYKEMTNILLRQKRAEKRREDETII